MRAVFVCVLALLVALASADPTREQIAAQEAKEAARTAKVADSYEALKAADAAPNAARQEKVDAHIRASEKATGSDMSKQPQMTVAERDAAINKKLRAQGVNPGSATGDQKAAAARKVAAKNEPGRLGKIAAGLQGKHHTTQAQKQVDKMAPGLSKLKAQNAVNEQRSVAKAQLKAGTSLKTGAARDAIRDEAQAKRRAKNSANQSAQEKVQKSMEDKAQAQHKPVPPIKPAAKPTKPAAGPKTPAKPTKPAAGPKTPAKPAAGPKTPAKPTKPAAGPKTPTKPAGGKKPAAGRK